MMINNVNDTNFNGCVYKPGCIKNQKISDAISENLPNIVDRVTKKPYDVRITTGLDYFKPITLTASNGDYTKAEPVISEINSRASVKALSKKFNELIDSMDKKLNIQA